VTAYDYVQKKFVEVVQRPQKNAKPQAEAAEADQGTGVLLKKGDEIGCFTLGSTIVMVFEAPENFTWCVEPDQKMQYGQSFGFVPAKEVKQ
jgi:phosphatidylserine decarboxylase